MEFTAIADGQDLRENNGGVEGCIRIINTDDEEVDVLTYRPGRDSDQTLMHIRESVNRSRYHATGRWNRADGCFHTCVTD